MKRLLALALAMLLCFGMCACTQKQNEKLTGRDAYVGEWKANVKVSSEGDYEVYVIKLNADETGSYKNKTGVWVYSEENKEIILTVTGGTLHLQIAEENGKTVLKYYQDTYYRASEFSE